MQKIYWCEEGLLFVDIVTKNVSEPDLTPNFEIYYGKTGKLRQNTCTRGVTEYRKFYGTRVLYD